MRYSREFTNCNNLDGTYCTFEGTRHDARTEEERHRLDSLRRELEIAIPCQQTRDVLLQLADGALNYTEIGNSLGCHRGTASRKLKVELAKAHRSWLALQLRKKLVEDGRFAIDPASGKSINNDSWAISIPNQTTIFSGIPGKEEITFDLAHKLQDSESFPTSVCLVGLVKDGSTHLGLSMLIPEKDFPSSLSSPSNQTSIDNLMTSVTKGIKDSIPISTE